MSNKKQSPLQKEISAFNKGFNAAMGYIVSDKGMRWQAVNRKTLPSKKFNGLIKWVTISDEPMYKEMSYEEVKDLTNHELDLQVYCLIESVAGDSFASPAVSGQEMKELIDIRNKLYNALPTGEVSAFDLITIIKWHINDIDTFISRVSESPSTPSGEAEGVPVSEYAKVLSLLESSFKQNAQPAKGFFTEDELNNGWRRYKAINEISESIPPVQEAKNFAHRHAVYNTLLELAGNRIKELETELFSKQSMQGE